MAVGARRWSCAQRRCLADSFGVASSPAGLPDTPISSMLALRRRRSGCWSATTPAFRAMIGSRDEDQTACKPGSVPPARCGRDGHSSGPPVAGRFSRPTRTPKAPATAPPALSRKAWGRREGPYSVLLQAGLAMPSRSPGPRWALTPPFHPCPAFALSGLRRGGLLSVALSLGSPPAGVTRRLVAVEPGLSSPAPQSARAAARPSGPAWEGGA